MKKKTPKRSTVEKKPAIKWQDEYMCLFSFRMKPVCKEYLEMLCQQLIEWAKNEKTAYKLMSFYRAKGIGRTTVDKWVAQNDFMKEAHALALGFIGDRREAGMIERRFDSGSVQFMMPHYDPDWQEQLENRNNLRKEVASASKLLDTAGANITIQMSPFESDK